MRNCSNERKLHLLEADYPYLGGGPCLLSILVGDRQLVRVYPATIKYRSTSSKPPPPLQPRVVTRDGNSFVCTMQAEALIPMRPLSRSLAMLASESVILVQCDATPSSPSDVPPKGSNLVNCHPLLQRCPLCDSVQLRMLCSSSLP